MLRHGLSDKPTHPSVQNYVECEQCGADRWKAFGIEAQKQTEQLCSFVRARVKEGKTVVGYGASAKSTQWLNACHFTKKDVRFVCDNTPQKLYKVCPGSDIPVVDEGALTRELPEYAILFSWNYLDEIIGKEKIFRERGGKWIVPVPNVQVL
jgi:methylation protein EvaC